MYGKLFLLFLAVGLILLGASPKGRQIWGILTGGTTQSVIPNNAPKSDASRPASDWDKHSENGAADGGTLT